MNERPLSALLADLDASSREPGPTMTITKAQYAYLLDAARATPETSGLLREALENFDNEATLPPRPTQYRRGWADAFVRAAAVLRAALATPEPVPGEEGHGLDHEVTSVLHSPTGSRPPICKTCSGRVVVRDERWVHAKATPTPEETPRA